MTALDMQPVPVIVASIGSPFAIAADPLAVGDVVDRARDRGDDAERARRLARELGGVRDRADRLDAAHLGLDADERRDLARVAAQHRDVDLVEDPLRGVGAVRGRAGADRVEHDRDAARVRGAAGDEHRLDPVATRACRC